MIPIKEHSERVKNKSFRILGDKPLAHWVVDSLLLSDYQIEVWINTDSPKVAEMFEDYGVKVYYRPEYLYGDGVSMNLIIQDWIEYAKKEGYAMYMQTHITNPFLSCQTIDKAIDTYIDVSVQGNYDSVMGVTRHQCRMWYNGSPVNFDKNDLIKTQDLIPVYEDNSTIYVFNRQSFYNNNRNRVGVKPFLLEVDFPENIDIDEETDWQLAEFMAG